MLVTQHPVLRRFWYPVMRSAALDDGKPHGFTLLGEAIVLWRKADGGVACLKDRCCHRTAKLSLGFVENDHVLCGYHGWEFDCSGTCVRIPQRPPGATVSPRFRVDAFKAQERYGHVWVALDEPLADIPELEHATMPGFRQVNEFDELWKISAFRLMENSFDPAHVAYVHRATFGDVTNPQVTAPQAEAFPYGVRTLPAENSQGTAVKVRGEVAQRATGTGDGATRRLDGGSRWHMPFMRYGPIVYPNGLVHVLVTCATPISDDETQVIQWVYRNDTEQDVSTADVIAHDRAITLEDKLILESCDPDIPLAANEDEMLVAADRVPLMMRRMLLDLFEAHGETDQPRAASGQP